MATISPEQIDLKVERCERGSSCRHPAKLAYNDAPGGPIPSWRLTCGVHAKGLRHRYNDAAQPREITPEIALLIRSRIARERTAQQAEQKEKRAAAEARHAANVREAWDDYPLRPSASLELDPGWRAEEVRTIIVQLHDIHPRSWDTELRIEIQPKGEPSYLELRNIRQLTPAQLAELAELLPVMSGWLEELNDVPS